MQTATANDTDSQEIRSQIKSRLWQERERIYAEIHAYPPPIPACDAQFNYLRKTHARRSGIEQSAETGRNGAANKTTKWIAPQIYHDFADIEPDCKNANLVHFGPKNHSERVIYEQRTHGSLQ